ncbi:Cytosolic phospholipase A2 beta [Escovopsis weberi]|uniref:Lysophospholipase n=1 Tax=Escovopsis weberi TaxID=150374 RepID=A0A0M9VW28_ESCWE|nr:Cytosolic phospholipase A2 beta [Escovopsis weberi]
MRLPVNLSRKLTTFRRGRKGSGLVPAVIALGVFTWWLYPSDEFAQLSGPEVSASSVKRSRGTQADRATSSDQPVPEDRDSGETAWVYFVRQFEFLSAITDLEWAALSERLVDAILPDWSQLIPGSVKKLQRELSASPGSLADEIWQEAHDPLVNPEILCSANVRISKELCPEEQDYLRRRKVATRAALAKYLGLDVRDIHPDDVPTIAMCGSGGGLRALIAGTGSYLATEEDGLFDCAAYTAGVSGSCWLQALYLSSFAEGSLGSLLNHLKSRASTHIAYPPVAFQLLNSLPTSKYLLSGLVEKLKGDPKADFGLVDIYGLLLGARFLIPKGELGVDASDFKISNQRRFLKGGSWPLPIYTIVQHEMPGDSKDAELVKDEDGLKTKKDGEAAKRAPYFQWFEITPYEFFSEESGAGIPTWALGRTFIKGKDVPPEDGFHLPEIRTPLLMGIFGSAFCASLSHYYREIRPLIKTMTGFGTIDEMISGRDDDLSKVHPIDPATIPNFAYQMHGMLPRTTPDSMLDRKYVRLMDAGMSNNLPIYPLLRPGRDIDILVAFDASADIKTDNWLSVADGYALQRGIKGWPVGIGWPKPGESIDQIRREISKAEVNTPQQAERKIRQAQISQEALRDGAANHGGVDDVGPETSTAESKSAGDLGYCTVWVGTTEERSTDSPPISTPITDADSWRLMEPNAGLAVVYLPLLSNDKVPGISPGTTEFLSTWNFVYTPDQIDGVIRLARANYDEGKGQIKATVRAVYERKKQLRERREALYQLDRYRSIVKRDALLRHGDQFG